jgi:predicted site-specific integrase-resolvase
VSSAGQKDNLAAQVTAMEQFCLARGLRVDEWLTEIGGGMDHVHDLVAVVHTFSSRLSGLRRYDKTLKKTLKDELGDGAR